MNGLFGAWEGEEAGRQGRQGRVGGISGEDSEDEMSRGAERVDLERGAAATSDTTVISRGGIGPGGDTRLLVEGVCL